jgi:hypothetical protein
LRTVSTRANNRLLSRSMQGTVMEERFFG